MITPANIGEAGKLLGKLGGVAFTAAALMWFYMHFRGYSDQAATEVAAVSIGIAGIANLFPSPIKPKDADRTEPPNG